MSWIVADLLSPEWGESHIKKHSGACWKFEKELLRGTKIPFSGCDLKCSSPPRDNSTHSISKTSSLKIGSKAIKPKDLELVKTSKWNPNFPFGNSVWKFWSTFQEILFSRENFRSGRQN